MEHTAILLGYVVLGWALAATALALAPRFARWGDRRALHQLALFSPLLVLALSGGWAAQMALSGCLRYTSADGTGTILIMTAVFALLAVAAARESWRIVASRRQLLAVAEPLALEVSAIAEKLGVGPPELRRVASKRAFAAVMGVRKPVVVLSDWMLENLSSEQLEALLAHELAHVRHRDNLIAWLDVVLLETFRWLPPMRRAWEESLAEREEAADARAAAATGKPLALAGALVAVAEAGAARPMAGAAAFHGEAGLLERRVERLVRGVPPGRPWGAPAAIALALALVLPFATSWSLGYWTSCLVHLP